MGSASMSSRVLGNPFAIAAKTQQNAFKDIAAPYNAMFQFREQAPQKNTNLAQKVLGCLA